MGKAKKVIMLLGITGMIGTLAGCGGNDAKDKSGAAEKDNSTSEAKAGDQGGEEKTEISVLVHFDPATDNPAKLDSFQEAADKLGYKINVERVDDATYKTKIRVMLQANELPDLFYTWGGSYSEPFLAANALYPLEDAIEESGYTLYDTYAQKDENGHNYVVPTGALESYCLFYNKEVFEEMGKEVPTDWEALLDVVEACNDQGIGAMGLADKDRWEGDLFYNMMVLREDSDAFTEAMKEGGAFTSEPFVTAAGKVQTLIEKNAFQNGYMQATPSECVELLKAGKIAMYPSGSWQVTALQSDDNLGCTVFPKTGKEDPYLSCCGNAADAGIAVSANSENREAAAKLAVEYSKIVNDHLAENGEQTYFETDIEETGQTEMMKTYIDNFKKLEKTQLWWFTYLDTAIGEPMRDLSQQQFAGEVDADDFIKQLESIIKGG